MKKRYYDYSVGLNTPYWIQELRTPKGKLIFRFDTPQNISFFVVSGLVLLVMILINVNTSLFSIMHRLTFGLSIILWVFLPLKLAKFYCEYEPDGKKMHQFLVDGMIYFFEFVLNDKKIYHGMRVASGDQKELIFEKTNL